MEIENCTRTTPPIPSSSSWGARHKLIMQTFFMCALCYSLRFNLSIAIVAMVDETPEHGSGQRQRSSHHEDICPSLVEANLNSEAIFIFGNISEGYLEEARGMDAVENSTSSPTFRWNERDQGLILGSFFWGYILSQIPAGLLAYKYGAKWIAGLGMVWTALFGIAIPHAAVLGGRDFVVLVRILQGFSSGFVIPSMVILLSKWCPPQERARLTSICMAGLPLGTASTYIVSGYLIPAIGWPSVFYLPGALTILWFTIWCCTVYSSPEEDPTISQEELKYFQRSFAKSNENEEETHSSSSEPPKLSDIPWKQIATSIPIWAVFTSQFCSAWGHNMLKSEGPKYLHSALHFNIHENSYLSAAPYLCQMVFVIIVGQLSDYLIEKKLVSMLNARKLCNSIGQWGSALFFAGIILAECNRTAAVLCYIFSGMINGAMSSGSYVNIIDISPKYSGTIEGVINAVANLAGFGAPYLAGLILYNEPSILGWNLVFFVPMVSNIIGNLVFILGASVQVQTWNSTSIKKVSIKQENRNNIE